MGKHVNKRLEVKTRFRELSKKEWGQILALHFPPAARAPICQLFLEGGVGLRDFLFSDGWYSPQQQVNKLFIRHKLPYRLRNFKLSDQQMAEILWERTRFIPLDDRAVRRAAGFSPTRIHVRVARVATKLCTVIGWKHPSEKWWIPCM